MWVPSSLLLAGLCMREADLHTTGSASQQDWLVDSVPIAPSLFVVQRFVIRAKMLPPGHIFRCSCGQKFTRWWSKRSHKARRWHSWRRQWAPHARGRSHRRRQHACSAQAAYFLSSAVQRTLQKMPNRRTHHNPNAMYQALGHSGRSEGGTGDMCCKQKFNRYAWNPKQEVDHRIEV